MILSYSRMSTYLQCPLKYMFRYVDKVWAGMPKPAHFSKGELIHSQLEDYANAVIAKANPPPVANSVRPVLPIIDGIIQQYPLVFTEKKIMVNSKYELCAEDDADAAFVMIADLLAVQDQGPEPHVLNVDYKSGKIAAYDDGEASQLKTYSTIMLKAMPQVPRVDTAYLFVEHQHTLPSSYTRETLDTDKVVGVIEGVRSDIANKKFDPKINQFCYWCDATKDMCRYSKKKK